MTKKLLLVNMIFGGVFHRFGTVLDENKIPPNLRRAKYLSDPNANITFGHENPFEEFETDDAAADFDDVAEDEEQPPPPRPSAMKRTHKR